MTAQSIPLNIAEVNEKRSLKDRARFLDITRGSILEFFAIQDVLVTTIGIKVQDDAAMNAMLTRMATKFAGVAESSTEHDAEIDYDYEHRCAEHEHESQTEEMLDPVLGSSISASETLRSTESMLILRVLRIP